jgi:lambda family phage portal protein
VAEPKLNIFDRLIMLVSPQLGLALARVRARVLARHFEAASVGRRTDGWSRRGTDANAAASGATLFYLRAQARDLVRNNPWARRGVRRLVTNTVGWGIRPKAIGRGASKVMELWKQWGETTECDAAGRLTFYGLQRQVMRTIVESGEVIIRRRARRPSDGLAIPLQLQVLEPDYIDTGKDGVMGLEGGPIVQGVEFNGIGKRVAYWLFEQHPGGMGPLISPVSKRVPADGVLHIFDQERPGQVRGTPWFASVDVRLHDFDEFEDATLMKQKISACLAAFVSDVDGSGTAIGEAGTDAATDKLTDTLEPGMILNLPSGKTVTMANPPVASDHQSFSQTALRGVAAGLAVTYEDLTGDYSQVNFSSARMARIAHMADVDDWRWNMLIPQFCAPAWGWMLDALMMAGAEIEAAPAEWTPPALPMIDPGTEGPAISRMVRTGAMTHDEMVRAQGYDPEQFWKAYAAGLARLDDLGIVLDSDPRNTTAAGQAQFNGSWTVPETIMTDDAPPSGQAPTNGVAKPNGKPNGKPAPVVDS